MTYKTLLLLTALNCNAQYEPPAGFAGTSAISKDDASILSWAVECRVKRGYQDISDPSAGLASAGDSTMACGKALDNGIVSLGDGGAATCTFRLPIKNKPGYDFAVFENSFSDSYLELAFVEVSSDGVNFYRFPSHSLTDTVLQTGPFDSTNCRKINNLAGKYRGGYGTPFDLEEMKNIPALNVDAIMHIRVVDVVGSVNNQYATRDSHGNKVNDPWPTKFASSGFDLDAIAVMHENEVMDVSEISERTESPYPVPATRGEIVTIPGLLPSYTADIFSIAGEKIMSIKSPLNTSVLSPGIYILTYPIKNRAVNARLIVY
jgi:hypothetical protein